LGQSFQDERIEVSKFSDLVKNGRYLAKMKKKIPIAIFGTNSPVLAHQFALDPRVM
jgi:hypothetical protein